MNRAIQFFIVAISTLIAYAIVLFRLPSVRLIKYSHAAELLIQGKLQGERILDFSPFYLYLNIFLRKLDSPPSVLLWIHIVCVAVSAALLFQLLRHYFRLPVAVAGLLAFIFDRSLMVYTHTFEPEPVVLLLILSATYFVSMQTRGSAFLGGLCFGLGILTRPNFVPVILVVPLFYKLQTANRWRLQSALFLIPAICCLAGLWIRNASITGYFSPFVMNPGTAYFEGNNPNSRGTSSVYPPVLNQLSGQFSRQPDYHHQLYRDFARRITGKNLTLPEVNTFWTSRAMNFLVDHPKRTLELMATKILHFFHRYLWHDLQVSYSTEQNLKRMRVPATPFSILSAFALLGLWGSRSQWKRYLIFYSVFFSQFLFMLAIYVSARQRISVLFLFVFFACSALQYILENKKRWILLVLVVIVWFPLWNLTDFMREETHLWERIGESNRNLSEAYTLRNRSRLADATNRSAKALALAPWLYESRRPANLPFGKQRPSELALANIHAKDEADWMDQGLLLLQAGKTGEAEQIFRRLQETGYRLKRDDYQSSELHFYLAQCALKNRKLEEAVSLLEKGLKNSPGDPSSLAFLKALTGKLEYEHQLLRYFDEIDVAFYLGKAYLEIEKPDAAIQQLQYVTKMLPEFRSGQIHLAAALSRGGKFEEGATAYRKAITMAPDPVFREEEILTIFRNLAQKGSAIDIYSYGIVLRQFGHFDEALAAQQQAASLAPTNQEIATEIRSLQKVLELNLSPKSP